MATTTPKCDHPNLEREPMVLADAIVATRRQPDLHPEEMRLFVDALHAGMIEGLGTCPDCSQVVYRKRGGRS
jgi:hypothetical protein